MMEVAEMMATTRGHDRAREYYRSIAFHARRDGRPDIAALAELRMIIRHWPAYAREDAIRKIAEDGDPTTRAAQLEARLALARMAYEHKDTTKGDAIVGGLAQYEIRKPILLSHRPGPSSSLRALRKASEASATGRVKLRFARPPQAAVQGTHSKPLRSGAPNSFASSRMPLNVENMWVDVGFRITPDGEVSDVEALRSHGDTGWAKPLLGSIAGRRYTPPQPGSPAANRVERYTFTSGLEPGTATHLAQHSPNARVEYFDLSEISAAN